MRNMQQQQQESEVAVPESWDVGSNYRIAAINVQGTTPLSFPNLHHHHDIDHPNNHEVPSHFFSEFYIYIYISWIIHMVL